MKDKYILLTGASGTLGEALLDVLAKEGYSFYLHGNKNISCLHKLIKKYVKLYPKQDFLLVKQDLSLRLAYNKLWQKCSKYGKKLPQIIIHAAGQSSYEMLNDLSLVNWEKLQRTHLENPLFLTQQALSTMLQQEFGRVIFVSSIWGLVGASCEAAYSSVKAAQLGLVKALAKEWGSSNLTINAVAPGVIDSPMLSKLSEVEKESLKEQIPKGRFAQPEEIADLISFLISDKASYISGQVISPNGAFVC